MKKVSKNNGQALNNLFQSFQTGINSTKAVAPKEYLTSLGLDYQNLKIGFNSGQFHHRKDEAFKQQYIELGVLTKSDAPTREPDMIGYSVFGAYSVVFALRDNQNNVVNLYSIRFKLSEPKKEYLNDKGIYPNYPNQRTTRLYLTENILDSATLLQCEGLENRDAVISLRDGKLTNEIIDVVRGLDELEHIVILSTESNTERVAELKKITSTKIEELVIPDNHTLNEFYQLYQANGVIQFLAETPAINTVENKTPIQQDSTEIEIFEEIQPSKKLIEHYEGKLEYPTEIGSFYVLGNLPTDLGTMKVSLHFEEQHSKRKHRNKIDLFDRNQLLGFSKLVTELEYLDAIQFESHLVKLTDELEKYRDTKFELKSSETIKSKQINLLPPEKQRKAIEFLSGSNLINRIDELIETSGVVGESSNRKMLFVIASTYKMFNPLHALVQGTSGSGKSHLINSIAGLMPQEDILNMTRVTSKSFYHYKDDELIRKLVLIQDFDGLDEEAQYAFREMQSAGFVSSSTTYKDQFGKLISTVKRVDAQFASMVATTHSEIYFDNMSRSIVVGVDESEEQTLRIIQHQNKKTAGLIDVKQVNEAKELLQDVIRTLKPFEVVNRYADKLQLPVEAKMLRRLNNHYQSFVNQITILHQFQREVDEQGRLIATPEDLKLACEILFEAIMWKIDELDSSLRQFFEQLKSYLTAKGPNARFTTREVRLAFNISKTQMFRYMEELRSLEYIQVAGGSSNRGYEYHVTYWDDIEKIRQKVKLELMNQIEQLK